MFTYNSHYTLIISCIHLNCTESPRCTIITLCCSSWTLYFNSEVSTSTVTSETNSKSIYIRDPRVHGGLHHLYYLIHLISFLLMYFNFVQAANTRHIITRITAPFPTLRADCGVCCSQNSTAFASFSAMMM